MQKQFIKSVFIIYSLFFIVQANGFVGEFELLHYDITGCSRLDAMSNTGYSFNCGISSVYLNPSLISDINNSFKRLGVSYGYVFTPEVSDYFTGYTIDSWSLKKHHFTIMIPELSNRKNIGGIGIDLDYLNAIETSFDLHFNTDTHLDTRSNLLTIAYGHSFRHNDKLIHSVGLSTKVDFFNQKIHFTDNLYDYNNEYHESEDNYVEQRYMVDISYSLRMLKTIQLSLILRNMPLEKKADYIYPLQFIVPASYTFYLFDETALTPELSYQFTNGIFNFHCFSAGSELSIQQILFLRLGLTMKLKKYNYSEFYSENAKRFYTSLNYSTGFGLNLFKQLSVDLFYKNHNGSNYFGFTATLHDISDFFLIK
ncbi:MAG: hypothetical protein JW915_16830 [Chitinispirillaceae bacterium]|nr:hypothetical protein [Chitinispirillaceae bacterium]